MDGQGEPDYFASLVPKIASPHTILNRILYAGMQPRATPKQIARAAAGAVKILSGRVETIVVLIDSEGEQCPGKFANEIRNAFVEIYGDQPNFEVVAKDRALENWLIADISAFKGLKGRFQPEGTAIYKYCKGTADHCERPAALLESMSLKVGYHKRKDPVQIARHQVPTQIAKNSRSFRRLLRVLSHPHYTAQSKLPCKD